jgi:hypothetical protein
MRNVLDKICEENKNTHYMFGKFFPKIMPFVRKYRAREAANGRSIWRMRVSCWISKATRARACSRPTRPGTHTFKHPHAQTHTHTHKEIHVYSTFCSTTAKIFSRTHPIVTVYVHCLSCLLHIHASSRECKKYQGYKYS